MMIIQAWKHFRDGDIYVVETDGSGYVLRACGPLYGPEIAEAAESFKDEMGTANRLNERAAEYVCIAQRIQK